MPRTAHDTSGMPATLGRFTPQGVVGRGAFGVAYRVSDPHRPGVALVLKLLTDSSPARVSKLLEELRAARSVDHPVLVETLEIGRLPSGEGFLLTPFAEGQPLRPPVPADLLPEIAAQALAGLEAIHAAGWRHGDIQPGNLLWAAPPREAPRVKILDFGLARELQSEPPPTRAAGGTPRYMAPELIVGQAVDERADLYSLGVILLECLRGAFTDSVGDHLLRARQGKLLAEVSTLPLPEPLGRLVRRMLEPDPAARLASAREGLEILGAAGKVPPPVPAFESATPIGRDALLAATRGAIGDSSGPKGRPQVILIEGEAGLGKTRAIAEAGLQALSAEVPTLSWTQLRAGSRSARSGSPGETAGSMSLPGGEHLDPAVDLEARRILGALGAGPVLVACDDLQVLPPEELRLLRSCVELAFSHVLLAPRRSRGARTEPRPVFLLTARPSSGWTAPLRSLWARLTALPWSSHFLLEPLARAESRELLARLLPPRQELGPVEEALLDDARGNPGRLRARLRELARTGQLKIQAGCWRTTRLERGDLGELPGERAALASAWDRLSPLERKLAGLAAVAEPHGSLAGLAALARSAGIPPAESEAAARSLARNDLLQLVPGTGGHRFELGRARRIRILRLAGRTDRRTWREQLGNAPGAPVTLALERAMQTGAARPEQVAEVAHEGGRSAEKLLASFARCQPAATRERITALRLLADLLLKRDRARRAEDVLREALEGATGADRAPLAVILAECAIARRDPTAARQALSLGEDLDRGSSTLAARAVFVRAAAALLAGEAALARDAAAEGLERWPDLPQLHNLLGNALTALGNLDAAGDAFSRAVARAAERGQPREEAAARTNHGRLLVRRTRLQEAAEEHRAAARLFESCDSRAEAATAWLNLGAALRRAGHFEEAVEALSNALSLRRGLGDDAGASLCEASLGVIAREQGLPGTALRRFRAAEAAAVLAGRRASDDLARNALVLEGRALLALALGRRAEALRLRELSVPHRAQEPSPEETLIALRLPGDPRSEQDLARAAGRTRLEKRDAPFLAELARQGKTHPEIAARARRALQALSQGSSRCRFYHETLTAEETAHTPEGRPAVHHLLTQVERFPEREARRRALVAVARHVATEPAEKAQALALLRKLLDEVLFDLEPAERQELKEQEEIKEALAMTQDTPATDGRTAGRSLEILREVFRLNRELLDEGPVEELVRRLVDAAATITGAEHGVLFLKRGGRLEPVAARSRGADLADAFGAVSRTVLERTLTEGKAILTTDAREDLSLRSIASIEELGLRSVLCVPLLARGRILGALYLDNSFERAVFDATDLEITESFCAQAVLALRSGEKREQIEGLLKQLRAANERLTRELEVARKDAGRRASALEKSYHGITGDSPAMRSVFELIEVIAPTEIPVLITGESGTGKELTARAIWHRSRRATRPFVAENCAAVPEGLLESALFGHVKGAFTGADSDRPGLFEMANGGTLFLDEIAEMPIDLQTRLLRVLQEREVRPIGGKKIIKVDVRIVAATNRDARAAVAGGKLREDLYYRLQGAEVRLPSLRERCEDVPLLVDRFLAEAARTGTAPGRLSPAALERLTRYSWPGNVRELENEVRRMAILARGGEIGLEHLSPHVREGSTLRPAGAAAAPLEVRPLATVERETILQAMKAFEGHRGKAAEALGISRSTLYLKLREYGYLEE